MIPVGPLYHLQEVSGTMTGIIRKFLQELELSERELADLRWYFHQWVAAMPRKPDDFERIKTMSQKELGDYYWDVLLDWGIDPL